MSASPAAVNEFGPVVGVPARLSPALEKVLLACLALALWGIPGALFWNGGRTLETALETPTLADARTLSQALLWGSVATLIVALSVKAVPNKSRLIDRGLTRTAPIVVIAGLYALAAASTLWSVSPMLSLYEASRDVLLLTLALTYISLPRRHSPPLVFVFAGVMVAQAVGILILLMIDPALVGANSFSFGFRIAGGVFEDYGQAGSAAALLGLAALRSGWAAHRRRIWIALVVVGATLTILSRTRTITLALFVGAGVLLMCDSRLRRPAGLGPVALLAGGVGSLYAVMQGSVLNFLLRERDGFATFTGRTLAFSRLKESWQDHFLLGQGYGAGSRQVLVDFVRQTGLGIGDAHDGYSAAMTDLGFVGVVVALLAYAAAVMAVWKTVRTLRKRLTGDERERAVMLLAVAYVVTSLVTTVASRGIVGHNPAFVVGIVTLAAAEVRDRRNSRRSERSHWVDA